MRELFVHPLVVGFALLFVRPSFCCADQPAEKSVWRLKRDVEERERQLIRARRELAEAQARVAQTEGKRDLLIEELRKVVAGYESEVGWIRDHANWFCDPRDLMTQTLWDMAKARVWLAEVEGDTTTLVAEWKRIVGFHEQQLDRFRRLEQLAAVSPEEKTVVQEALDKARKQLSAVEQKLAAENAKKPEQSN